MASPIQLRIYTHGSLVHSLTTECALELGRQKQSEPPPYHESPGDSSTGPLRSRLVIAPLKETSISREHVLLTPVNGGQVKVRNLSRSIPIETDFRDTIPPGDERNCALPVLLSLGEILVRAMEEAPADSSLESLGQPTLAPGQQQPALQTLRSISVTQTDPEALVRWLQGAMGVLQSAVRSTDFFEQSAEAILGLGLDSAGVLLRNGDGWRLASLVSESQMGERTWQPSTNVLKTVSDDKKTVWQMPRESVTESLSGVHAVVAAPILDQTGGVVGILYGDRRQRGESTNTAPITRLEAMIVELVACAVAAGLARMDQERAALAARVKFEQVFTSELAHQLESDPGMLSGRAAEVSILFCDIRGFSRVSERLGPEQTFEWIGDVMNVLSEAVFDHQGVLVDYVGDALIAMWGAPEPQPAHASLACQAGLDMMGRIPELNRRWIEALGEEFSIGLGIHSGPAHVGNTGSKHKFKYGPLGSTVNVASRVEGATKILRCGMMITGESHRQLDERQLDNRLPSRRLCTVQVVNVQEPVELYEIPHAVDEGWEELKRMHESALAQFEEQQFGAAARLLGDLLSKFPDDGPALVLLSRTVQALVDPPDDFDPVWRLPHK